MARSTVEIDRPDRILRLPAVADRTGLSRTTIYRKAAAGDFPPPVKLGARASGWHESVVDAWIASREPAGDRGAA